MILVTASIRLRPESLARGLELGRDHAARSRAEPGCVSHEVLLDPGDGRRLVFLERWDSRDALHAHFRHPASREFVRRLRELSDEPEEMEVYEASRVEM